MLFRILELLIFVYRINLFVLVVLVVLRRFGSVFAMLDGKSIGFGLSVRLKTIYIKFLVLLFQTIRFFTVSCCGILI